MSDLNIAIIGAGPAGCALARMLLNEGIAVTIFEREASSEFRAQGATVDLHTDTGLAALKKAGLYDEFLKLARFDGEALIVSDKHLKRYINMPGTTEGSSRGRPEIDRKQLRDLLLASLPPDIVRWNHNLRNVTSNLDLEFSHNTTETGFDLVIGAEGAWSKVRSLLTTEQPFFTGLGAVRLAISNAEKRQPKIHALVNKGSLFAIHDRKALMLQQMGDKSIVIHAFSTKKSDDWLKELPHGPEDLSAVKRATLTEYASWAPDLLDAIRVADATPWVASMYMLPTDFTWEHRPGVTLLGDAAHLMTPFAGEGVNLALVDAMRLSDAIVAASKEVKSCDADDKKAAISTHIEAFEKDMFVRAHDIQRRTFDMMSKSLLEPDFPARGIETWIIRAAADEVPAIFMPLFKVAVYAYFSYFRLYYWLKV